MNMYPFDARGIGKRFRHAAIFGALDALTPGETMRFFNDHDPVPLLRQMEQRYGEAVRVEYLQREHGVVIIDFTVVAQNDGATRALPPAGCG
ncbi:DUF2249 domain-containing protein [Lysobacter changpingensis]|uniref:DUF2249 domain-containing protein n=1 Tax=Lysobacter changpingensis TaxID=2792784 RepID=UPI001A8CC08F|nr:DUF2249 domain-containing protein [Lysobacter changpingensis]